MGSLSNEDGKKAIGLDWQNNNFARGSRFFVVHFFAVTARLRRENAFFTFCWGRERKTTAFVFFSWNVIQPSEFSSKYFANIWRIKLDGISAIKFEAAQIHFLSDFVVAVAVVVAYKAH